jgi:hypothetical protein
LPAATLSSKNDRGVLRVEMSIENDAPEAPAPGTCASMTVTWLPARVA